MQSARVLLFGALLIQLCWLPSAVGLKWFYSTYFRVQSVTDFPADYNFTYVSAKYFSTADMPNLVPVYVTSLVPVNERIVDITLEGENGEALGSSESAPVIFFQLHVYNQQEVVEGTTPPFYILNFDVSAANQNTYRQIYSTKVVRDPTTGIEVTYYVEMYYYAVEIPVEDIITWVVVPIVGSAFVLAVGEHFYYGLRGRPKAQARLDSFLNFIHLSIGLGVVFVVVYETIAIFCIITCYLSRIGKAVHRLAAFVAFPYGRAFVVRPGPSAPDDDGCISRKEIIFFLFFGLPLALTHIILGMGFCMTIILIPTGSKHLEAASMIFMPKTAKVVFDDEDMEHPPSFKVSAHSYSEKNKL